MAMKETYLAPEMKVTECELYELIAASFRDDESQVVSDTHAGSRRVDLWDEVDE